MIQPFAKKLIEKAFGDLAVNECCLKRWQIGESL